jgi:hypothetical protein
VALCRSLVLPHRYLAITAPLTFSPSVSSRIVIADGLSGAPSAPGDPQGGIKHQIGGLLLATRYMRGESATPPPSQLPPFTVLFTLTPESPLLVVSLALAVPLIIVNVLVVVVELLFG